MSRVDLPPLSAVAETLLLPLWARAVESARPDALFQDPQAAAVMAALDYDFTRFDPDSPACAALAVRTRLFDDRTREFLQQHPDAVVLEIGAGLDSRYDRLGDAVPSGAFWFDVDLPEVVALRRRFFTESDNRAFIPADITRPDWSDGINTGVCPTLILAAGVLMYLPEPDVRRVFQSLAARFPGAVLLFDFFSPFMARQSDLHDLIGRTTAAARWGIVDAAELEQLGDFLRVDRVLTLYDLPAYPPRIPERLRAAAARSSRLRNLHRIAEVTLL